MATLTVTLSAVCSGGNHLTFTVSGDYAATVYLNRDRLDDPITENDPYIVVICKMAKKNRTFAQARAILQAGVPVTI